MIDKIICSLFVLLLGTLQMCIRDRYNIIASVGDTLSFSIIGFDKEQRVVGKSNRMDIMLHESKDVVLADLIVTGYSKQERRDLTGSVASVKLDDNVSFRSVDQMLQDVYKRQEPRR